MKTYCLGFAFYKPDNFLREQVLLITKNKPAWQAGRLNGVGGHIEPGENPWSAMSREFLEEAGIETLGVDWSRFCIMVFPGSRVHCFTMRLTQKQAYSARSCTSEYISWQETEALPGHVMPNLHWLIPMAGQPVDPRHPLVIYDRAHGEK